jgi:hypothetical protein
MMPAQKAKVRGGREVEGRARRSGGEELRLNLIGLHVGSDSGCVRWRRLQQAGGGRF